MRDRTWLTAPAATLGPQACPRPNVFAICTLCLSCGRVTASYSKPGARPRRGSRRGKRVDASVPRRAAVARLSLPRYERACQEDGDYSTGEGPLDERASHATAHRMRLALTVAVHEPSNGSAGPPACGRSCARRTSVRPTRVDKKR